MLRLSNFDYCLSKELIAQYPLKQRTHARLLVIERKTGKITHTVFKDLPGFLSSGDLLVLNDSKVLPCRLIGRRATGGKVDVLLLGAQTKNSFTALIKPSRLRPQEKIIFNGRKLYATLTGRNTLRFSSGKLQVYAHGLMPLPPYIKRMPQKTDNIYYQTVYARNNGSVASPTAGLHFDRALLAKIKSRHITTAYLTLHVGYGTFKPVKAADIRQHKMEKEAYFIPAPTIKSVKEAKRNGARVIAVGTTSLRALETYAINKKLSGYTDLFIYPGYKFKIADCLLTNFHLPRTTLFMLACAFAGENLIKRAYKEAVAKRYRFYSYGDAMLII